MAKMPSMAAPHRPTAIRPRLPLRLQPSLYEPYGVRDQTRFAQDLCQMLMNVLRCCIDTRKNGVEHVEARDHCNLFRTAPAVWAPATRDFT